MRSIGLFWLMSTVFTIAMTSNHFIRREDSGIAHLQKITSVSSSSSGKLSNGSTILCWICSPILFIMSFVIVWNNERKAAIDHRRISLVKSIIIEVNPYNIRQVQGADGKLVHACGDIKSNQAITDIETGLRINGIVKIKRQIQVRQMRQHNGRYQPVWVSNPQQQSVAGGPANDHAAWFLTNGCTYGPNVYLGNYLVSQSLKQQLLCLSPYTPTMQDALIISNKHRTRNKPLIDGDYIYFPSSPGSVDSLGSLRVKFWICKAGPVSVISQSCRNTFTPFEIDVYENGQQDGQINQSSKCTCCFLSNCTADMLSPINKIDIISEQHLTSDEMIESEKKKIDCSKNSLRVLSYAIMVFSICGFFLPITSLIGHVPLIGSFLSGALGLAIFIAASLISIPLFLLAVAIAWLVFHPKTGLIILGVGLIIGGILLAIMLGNKRKDTYQTAQILRHTIFSLRTLVKK